jgi:hypothetical protein
MLSFDYYLMLRSDRTVDVYDRHHTAHGTYSSIAKCQEFLMPWVLSRKETVGTISDGKWIPLMDDGDWVMFLLSRSNG